MQTVLNYLWALAEQREDTSPFLHGFTPPLYLGNLRRDEARALIRQDRLPADRRPAFDGATVEAIRLRCGGHPYLIQLVCRRRFEIDDLEEVFEDTLRVHVHRLRQKIEPDKGSPRYLITQRGVGYSFLPTS